MVDVEAVQLAVADHLHAGLFLDVDDEPGRIHQCLFRGAVDQPLGYGIGADDGGLYSGHAGLWAGTREAIADAVRGRAAAVNWLVTMKAKAMVMRCRFCFKPR
jgi:hypothetical protein